MAVVFIKDLDETRLNLIYNNNVVKFYSNSAEVVLRCEITFDANTITLFPSPDGLFYYNFKELLISEINQSNYADTLSPDLDTSVVYNWITETYKNTEITFTIFLANDTTETAVRDVHWLSAYVQLRDYKQTYPADDLLVATPALLQKKITDSYFGYFVKYWAGFPFDITLFNNTADVTITNNTNAISYLFNTTSIVNRFFFSDGRIDVSIEDYIPLQVGYNDLDFNGSFNLLVEKITSNCDTGHYIKWINSFGGWSYWLFDKGNETVKTKEDGFLFNDYENLEDTTSPLVSMGKTSQNEIQLRAEALTENEKTLLSDLFESTKVYLFTGTQFSKNSFNDWMEVNLVQGTFKISNARGNQYNFNMAIELPANVTRSL